MKLIGSRLERTIESELRNGRSFIFNADEMKDARDKIETIYEKISSAFILNWIPEQGEDIYDIYINNKVIINIEVDRFTGLAQINEITSEKKYKKGKKKNLQLKILIANRIT